MNGIRGAGVVEHDRRWKHGHARRGRLSPEYQSWRAMIERCYRPRAASFRYYGGRGIAVAPEWRGAGGFARFLEHLGPRPPGTTLHRIDSDEDYGPLNVCWTTRLEQRRGRRDSKLSVVKARAIRALQGRLPRREIAAALEVSRSTVGDVVRGRTWTEPLERDLGGGLVQLGLFDERRAS